MPTDTVAITEKHQPISGGGGTGQDFGDDGFGGEGGGFPGGPKETSLQTYLTGMWLGLGAITMLFAAFTSAYIVRRGMSDDWRPTEIPVLLWCNTFVLVASSLTLERARRSLRAAVAAKGARLEGAVAVPKALSLDVFALRQAFRRWWSVTTALGGAFLFGQIVAWRQLAAQGVYMASNPSSSFFYLLTGAHGLHLLGGVVALLYVVFQAWRWKPIMSRRAVEEMPRTAVEVTALYWHFMDGLWVYLFLVLLFWR